VRLRHAPRVRSARVLATLVVAAAMAGAASAQPPPPAPHAEWHGTGVVLAMLRPPSDLHATRPVIVLQHEPIPGLMKEAMTMPFIVASVGLFAGLHAGDHVAFALADTPGALLVVSLERLP
jgi:Cu/Ag efflux protein CusF